MVQNCGNIQFGSTSYQLFSAWLYITMRLPVGMHAVASLLSLASQLHVAQLQVLH